jgi:hypothetical protein
MSKNKHIHYWLCSDVPGQYYCDKCSAKGWWNQMHRRIDNMTAKEISAIKSAAVDYAKRFLAKKYHIEYTELYQAYCRNRGVDTNSTHGLVDERLLTKHE